MSITENLKTVRDRIAAAAKRVGRDPESVKLVVVTKTIDSDRIREAIAAGAQILGENRVQEAQKKIEELEGSARWHLIGHLQTNKAKYAVKLFGLIHSVDSLELARELDRQAAKIGKKQQVLIEINISGEQSKSGMDPQESSVVIKDIAKLGNIAMQGLMTMPPFSEDPEESRRYFRALRELARRIADENIPGVSMNELSMGMSGDFEVAVEEGATMVRVGTAIFGERTK